MNKNVTITQINYHIGLTKQLLDITNKILSENIDNENWIQKLLAWSDKSINNDNVIFPKIKDDILKITKINLRWNRLVNIPVELCNIKQLKVLELNNNNLTGLPKEITKLQNLEELNLNINNLTTLPKEIIQLKKLKVLNIKNNKYLELSVQQKEWLKELADNGCIIKYDKYKFNLGE